MFYFFYHLKYERLINIKINIRIKVIKFKDYLNINSIITWNNTFSCFQNIKKALNKIDKYA